MRYHIAFHSDCDLQEVTQQALAGKCPAHTIWDISQVLSAKIHYPGSVPILYIDKILSKIIGNPNNWALARQLSTQVNEQDVIFCNGEQVGIPIATYCSSLAKPPKIFVLVNNLNRPRGRLALKLLRLFNIISKIDRFLTYTSSQAKFLQDYLQLPEHFVQHIASMPAIDTVFFSPGQVSERKKQPLIASGGLEKRDYRTLALATQDLDVDVKVCAYSPNAKKLKRNFPEQMPENMSCEFYDWPDLRQLYRNSDLVVIPLFENNYEAGLTTLFEALACQKPVIMTRAPQPGIINELIDAGIITGVNPGDVIGLQEAILKILNDPQKFRDGVQLGYELTLKQYNHHVYVKDLVAILTD